MRPKMIITEDKILVCEQRHCSVATLADCQSAMSTLNAHILNITYI